MATRSTIALEYADGTVDKIYCHWDGYLDNNGQILYKHYSDPFKLQRLMNLGDLSSLHADIGDKHDFDDRAACEDVCTFYGRDRGETGTEAKRYKSYSDYRENAQFEEYNYILRTDGIWYVEFYGKEATLGEAIADELKERAEQEETL